MGFREAASLFGDVSRWGDTIDAAPTA